ncbi:MAG: gp16 family protein [Sphingomonadaceae bacterium]
MTVKAHPARFDRSAQHRRAMLAKINIARHQLAMDEDDYRQMLVDETGHMSLRECSEVQLERILARLKKLGFKPLPSKRGSAATPAGRKARALWISLYQLGAVRNPSEKALEAFAQRQIGCTKLNWARSNDVYRLIEALKAMATRHGWAHPVNDTPLRLQEGLCEAILLKMKCGEFIPADWTLDIAAWRLCGIDTGKSDSGYTAEHYQRLAAALGAQLRAAGLQEAE